MTLTKIRTGLYHTTHAGHLIEIERLTERSDDLNGMWIFRIDPYDMHSVASEPRWTRRETLEIALRTAEQLPRPAWDVSSR